MPALDADVAVVGAGVVGCAVASRLARAGRSVLLLEREARAGTGTTSRNSQVVHSGLYYAPGSRKATTCVEGNALLWDWARAHAVPCARTGKLVVAFDPAEHDALARLFDNARACGAPGCRWVSPATVARHEPDLPPVVAALHCARTGIVDPVALTRSCVADAERHGATFVPHADVTRIRAERGGFRLSTSRGTVATERLVNAAGLHADEVAAELGLRRTIHPCRGDYFRLRTSARYRRLVYPVRAPGAGSLGVHLVLDLDGGYRLGPDATFVARKDDFSAAAHKRGAFAAAARRLLGPIDENQLEWDSCGLRPRLAGEDEPSADFELVEHPAGALHLLGIESPGLTAALALALEVAQRA
jgi:L-2-hydroxyglutarate oxidase LhgO